MTAISVSPGPVETENNSVSTFRLRRRTPGSFVLVPFPKGGRSIRCQGQLEAAAAVILANCPLVAAIHEQPFQIRYAWHETKSGLEIRLLDQQNAARPSAPWRCTYIVPDFLVTMTVGRRHLVEVKPSSKLGRLDVQRKLSVARRYAEGQGWTFHVVTEVELRRGSLISNPWPQADRRGLSNTRRPPVHDRNTILIANSATAVCNVVQIGATTPVTSDSNQPARRTRTCQTTQLAEAVPDPATNRRSSHFGCLPNDGTAADLGRRAASDRRPATTQCSTAGQPSDPDSSNGGSIACHRSADSSA